MPEITASVNKNIDRVGVRRRKRGTSIVPTLPLIFSGSELVHKDQKPVEEEQSRTLHTSSDSGVVSEAGHKSSPALPSIRHKHGLVNKEIPDLAPSSKVPNDKKTLIYHKASAQKMSPYLARISKMPALDSQKTLPVSIEDWLYTMDTPSSQSRDGGTDSKQLSYTRIAKPDTLPNVQKGRIRDSDVESLFAETELNISARRRSARFQRDPIATYHQICRRQKVAPVDKFLKQFGQSDIDLRNHLLGPADIRAISIAMALDGTTQRLDISGNTVGPVGTSYLAEALQTISQINVLVMAATFPDVKGCRLLADALRSNDCLRMLNLGENQLGEQHAVQLATFIKVTQTLRELYLNHNRLDEAGGRAIGEALAWNRSIQTLDLTWNHLRRGGAIAICKALEVNTTLEKLNVSWNGFSVEGCKCLVKVLPKNDTLRHFDLSSNRINSRALAFLMKGLVKNEGITSLKIGRNPLTTGAAIAFIEMLNACDYCSIDDLDLSDVPVDEEFLEAVERLREKRIVSIRHGPLYRQDEVKQGEQSKTMGIERFDPVLVLYEYMKMDSMRLVDMFHYFDTDQNGYITLAEFREGFLNAHIPLTEDNLEQLVKNIDIDRDGKVDLQELMAGHRKFSRSVAERNKIAKSRHKAEDRSLTELRRIIKKFLTERNEKLKETKTDNDNKTITPAHRLSTTESSSTRRPSRRSRVSVVRPRRRSAAIPEGDEGHPLIPSSGK